MATPDAALIYEIDLMGQVASGCMLVLVVCYVVMKGGGGLLCI